jgi:hypothetical protein
MSIVVFEDQAPDPGFDPGRADVACFVGYVRLLGGAPLVALPSALETWFSAQGWTGAGTPASRLLALEDVPVPIDSLAGFAGLFETGASESSQGTDYVAAAVRSFFAQGGRRCYVVRLGDPLSTTGDRAALLAALLPKSPSPPTDQRDRSGIEHLAALPDVSLLALPDLPVLCASPTPLAAYTPAAPPPGPEVFVECDASELVLPAEGSLAGGQAPRLSLDDYATWGGALRRILSYVSLSAREVQVVAAMPIPRADGTGAVADAAAGALAEDVHQVVLAQMGEKTAQASVPGNAASLSSAFLQLGYPWLKTAGSSSLLESLEPPDGVLAGMIARNALTRGTFTSVTKGVPSDVYDIWPPLPMEDARPSSSPLTWNDDSRKPLLERLSIFGFTPRGLGLLSDVTAFAGESYRPGPVNRLVSVICRAARRLGEEVVFAENGPNLWARIESLLSQLLTTFWRLDALEGASASDAFTVRCGKGTMTQNDIDEGRAVAVVTFSAAARIDVIRVTLSIEASAAGGAGTAMALPEVA